MINGYLGRICLSFVGSLLLLIASCLQIQPLDIQNFTYSEEVVDKNSFDQVDDIDQSQLNGFQFYYPNYTRTDDVVDWTFMSQLKGYKKRGNLDDVKPKNGGKFNCTNRNKCRACVDMKINKDKEWHLACYGIMITESGYLKKIFIYDNKTIYDNTQSLRNITLGSSKRKEPSRRRPKHWQEKLSSNKSESHRKWFESFRNRTKHWFESFRNRTKHWLKLMVRCRDDRGLCDQQRFSNPFILLELFGTVCAKISNVSSGIEICCALPKININETELTGTASFTINDGRSRKLWSTTFNNLHLKNFTYPAKRKERSPPGRNIDYHYEESFGDWNSEGVPAGDGCRICDDKISSDRDDENAGKYDEVREGEKYARKDEKDE